MAYLVNSQNTAYGSACYKLISDIDLDAYWTVSGSSASLTSGTVWTPIGLGDAHDKSNSKPFSGTFDGGGCVIYGLFINDSDLSCAGLFGYVVGGTVKNVGVLDSYIYAGGTCVGGIAGYASNSTIDCCYNGAAVSGASCTGGVTGSFENGSLTNCYNTGAVTCSIETGGVSGTLYNAMVSSCYNTGAISTATNVGGVTGEQNGSTLTNCYYLTGTASVGVGLGDDATSSMAAADMQAAAFVTHLGGPFLQDNFSMNGGYPLLRCNFESGDGTDANPYRINTGAQLRNMAYLVGDAVGNYNSAHYELLRDIDVLTKWTLGSDGTPALIRGRAWTPIGIWNDDGNSQHQQYEFPFNGVFDGAGHTVSGVYLNDYLTQDFSYRGLFGAVVGGTVKNVGLINSAIRTGGYSVGGIAGLLIGHGTIDHCYNSSLLLGTGYTVGGVVGAMGIWAETWTVEGQMGAAGDSFNVVSNCYNTGAISSTRSRVGGVVGLEGGGNPSLAVDTGYYDTISNCYNTASVTATYGFSGGILGDGGNGQYLLYVEGCHNSGAVTTTDISTSSDAFGIGHTLSHTVISDCYNTGTVTANYEAAGLAAYAWSMDNCFNTGSVNATVLDASGIIAMASIVTNCHNSGTITGGQYASGIAGQATYNGNESISDCYNTGTVTATVNDGLGYAAGVLAYSSALKPTRKITNCYNTGAINGGSGVGGIGGVGPVTYTSCYNTGAISGTGSVGGVAGGLASGQTLTNCYNTGTVTGTDSNTDFGGLAGTVYANATLSNSYDIGAVSGYAGAGGVAGSADATASVTNCYYLNTAAAAGIGIGPGEADATLIGQFKSGETAHLLQGSQTGTAWGHTKLNGTELPRLAALDSTVKKVVRVGFYDNTGGAGTQNLLAYSYTLYGGTATFPAESEAGKTLTWVDALNTVYTDSSAFIKDTSLFLSRNGTVVLPTPTLVSITAPAPITGIASGTPMTSEALGLPTAVTLVTDYDTVQANVAWTLDSTAYDPTATTEQTFTVYGTVTLPGSMANTNGVSLTTSVSVTVNASLASTKTTLVSITAPAAITGVANGTAKTAGALGLPAAVELCTQGGHVWAGVTWDVGSSAYNLSNLLEQTFTVNGTVTTLPGNVTNSNNVSLTTAISVTVSAATPTLTITTTALPGATAGSSYSQSIGYVYTGTGPLTFSASGLPAGLTISSGSGLISGTPTAAAVFGSPYAVTVISSDGTLLNTKVYSLTITSPDTTQPTVTEVTPNGTSAPTAGDIVITFSTPMNTGVGTVSLDGGTTFLTGGTWSNSDQTYTVSYSALTYSINYTVSISDFKNVAGMGMTADSTHDFTTEADTTVPVVTISVSPASPSVQKGGTQLFAATVSGSDSTTATVTRSVSGQISSGTGISSSGLLTVASDETATSLTVTATPAVGHAGTANVTVTDTIPAPSYSITLSFSGTYDFADLTEGYGPQAAKTITVTNTGNQPTGVLELSSGGSDFTLSPTTLPSIDVGGTASFTVEPATGLTAGIHSDAIIVGGPDILNAQGFGVRLKVNAVSLTIDSTALPAATVGSAYSQSIAHTYTGTGTLSFSATGLPSGLAIDSGTGVISGMPDNGSDTNSPYNVTVTVGDGILSVPKTYSLSVNAAFTAVTGITGVPSTATVGVGLPLTGAVAPADATNQIITWSVQSAGTTGASISGTTLSTTAAGTVTVMATITNGLTASSDYTQTFRITVSAASPATYNLSLSAGPGGSITTGSGGSYQADASIILVATANTDYRFTGWSSSNGGSFGNASSASTTFVMPPNATIVTATFTYTGGGGGGSTTATPTYYTITATAGTGGSISPSGSVSVASGNDKTYTVAADNGYDIQDILVDGVSVGAVSTYSFTNVTKAHTIAATFKQKSAQAVSPFTDVSVNDWFYDNVLSVYSKGLMTGTSSGTFNPSGTMTRGMLVTVLYRMSHDTGRYTGAFSDVPSGAYYENAVAWAAKNGIASGTGANRFSPNGAITREQLAAMLYNYAKYKGYDVSADASASLSTHPDASGISGYARAAMQWVCSAGILNGDRNGKLNPQSSATRAEVAVMLERFMQKFSL